MPSIENELQLDFSGVNQTERLKALASVKRAGGIVLNEDLAPFIDSAPPQQPAKRLTFDLEKELAACVPFSAIIHRYHSAYSIRPHFYPEYKEAIFEKVRPLGIKELGLISGLKALCGIKADTASSSDQSSLLDIMRLTVHSGRDYQALTLNDPSQVTAERLRKYTYGLGQTGANAALAVLVESSKTSSQLHEA